MLCIHNIRLPDISSDAYDQRRQDACTPRWPPLCAATEQTLCRQRANPAQPPPKGAGEMPNATGPEQEVPVLIVGGSLVGLAAALFLRWHGVDVLAVERHAGTAINARAGHFHLRTVEILRSAGLEDAVQRKSEEQYPPDGGINNVESLAGREIANYFPDLNAGVDEFSPTVRLFINQDALEPILRAR